MSRPITMLAALLVCAVASAQEPVPLVSPAEPAKGWKFDNGREFPGAVGSLAADPDVKREAHASLKLVGDFTKGGRYVQAGRSIANVDVRELTLWVRNPDAERFTLRLIDGSGQVHQLAIRTEPTPDWQKVVLPLERFFARRGQADAVTTVAKYESWGGAKDGKWHGPATGLYILISPTEKAKVRNLWLGEVSITPPQLFAQPPAFTADFEKPLEGWKTTGGAALDAKTGHKSTGSLRLARTVNETEKPSSATSPSFKVQPGRWQVALANQSDLKSPDNSYNAAVTLVVQDDNRKVLERFTIAEVFGKQDWTPLSKTIELPKNAANAFFQVQLNKTHGEFRLDDLSATYLAPAPPRDDSIIRLLFASPRLGNLLLPTDPRKFDLTLETRRPLKDNQHTISLVVRDYWGSEQSKPITATLTPAPKKTDRLVYTASIDLADVPLEIGRYYELHASIPQAGEAFQHQTSFAILPEAETKKYKPEEIPFTSRNWDNRVPAFIELTDRLGVRICGLWGSWSAKPPYKPEAPGLEQVKKLGMGWLTTTPIKLIERGNTEFDEKALRQGVRNLIETHGSHRPFIINLGNEPHGTGERVLKNVEAYRIVYDEVKKVDPTIPVVATSVEPNEEYFKAGYGKYCDAYDFHIYESPDKVRKTMGEYRELMKKYDVVKPIWSTELGLNSQGQTRLTVASELVKKFSTFFAAGGTSVSWFGLLYPDAEGKSHGSSGDSHNVFDCRFNRYAPRLDAVAYYHMVNAIAIKKFLAEKSYDNGIDAVLFKDRDGRKLQVLWAEKGRQDVAIPLPGVEEVEAIHIDGTHRKLAAGGKGITLGVSDPVLLLYTGGPDELPATLVPSTVRLEALPKSLSRKDAASLTVSAKGLAAEAIELQAPPFWQVSKTTGGNHVVEFRLTPSPGTAAHQAAFRVLVRDGDKIVGDHAVRLPFSE